VTRKQVGKALGKTESGSSLMRQAYRDACGSIMMVMPEIMPCAVHRAPKSGIRARTRDHNNRRQRDQPAGMAPVNDPYKFRVHRAASRLRGLFITNCEEE